MGAPQRKVDQHGFLIPVTFEELQNSASAPCRPRFKSPIVRRLVILALVLILVGGVFGPQLVNWGQNAIAERCRQLAEEKFLDGDVTGAIADADRAIQWSPDAPEGYLKRGVYRLHDNQLQASLEDFNEAIRRQPAKPKTECYIQRCEALQRMGRWQDAVDDAGTAIRLDSASSQSLNCRAYARALGNAAGALDSSEVTAGLDDIQRALEMEGQEVPAYLDTRGYLRYLKGDYQSAMIDMQRAIEITQAQSQRVSSPWGTHFISAESRASILRSLDENLAVMYHHRGLIHEKLGNAAQAKADLAKGDELGFDPAKE